MRPDGTMIRDLGSTNGAYAEDRRICVRVNLHDNEFVAIGPCLFELRSLGADPNALPVPETDRINAEPIDSRR